MITLYSTGCPKCKTLHKMLDMNNVDYKLIDDISIMEEKGFFEVPILEVDGKMMRYNDAIKWIRMVADNEEQ